MIQNFRLEDVEGERVEPRVYSNLILNSNGKEGGVEETFSNCDPHCDCNVECRCNDKCNHCHCVDYCRCDEKCSCEGDCKCESDCYYHCSMDSSWVPCSNHDTFGR